MLQLLRPIICIMLLTFSTLATAIQSIDMKRPNGADWTTQLRTGQILTTESSGALHFPTMLGSDRYSPAIHLGIVEVAADGIHVYDTTAEFGKYFIGGRSPSDTMEGSVRRLTLSEFIDYAKVFNIYNPPSSVDPVRLVSFLRQSWQNKIPFDPYFNLDDRSALYCSELIATALEYAGSRPITPGAMRYNPSLDVIRQWMKIRAPRFLFPYQMVEARNWVGTISLDFSSQAILIDRLVKFELYQRFTSNQKIGNLLQLSGTELILREPIQQLSTIAHNLSLDSRYSNAGMNELYSVVRGIANQTLGPANVRTGSLPRCQLDPRSCAAN